MVTFNHVLISQNTDLFRDEKSLLVLGPSMLRSYILVQLPSLNASSQPPRSETGPLGVLTETISASSAVKVAVYALWLHDTARHDLVCFVVSR